MRFSALFAALVTGALLVLGAAAADAKSPAEQAGTYIEGVGNEALKIISNKALSKDKKQADLEALFHQNVDFNWVGKFVMGRFWRQATPAQQKRYLSAYRDFLTRGYTARFAEYTSGTFKVTSTKETDKGEFVVGMEIISDNKGEPPIVIDYKIRKQSGGFKVFDIIVEGVSLITTQRSEFGSVLNKNGVDGLIEMLEKRSTELASR